MPAALHLSQKEIEAIRAEEKDGSVEIEIRGRYPVVPWSIKNVLSFINACLDDGGLPQFVTFGGRIKINGKPAVMARCLYGRNNVRLEIKDHKIEFHYDRSGIPANTVIFKDVPEDWVRILDHWRHDYKEIVMLFGDEKLKEKVKKAPIVLWGEETVRP